MYTNHFSVYVSIRYSSVFILCVISRQVGRCTGMGRDQRVILLRIRISGPCRSLIEAKSRFDSAAGDWCMYGVVLVGGSICGNLTYARPMTVRCIGASIWGALHCATAVTYVVEKRGLHETSGIHGMFCFFFTSPWLVKIAR